MNNVTKLKPRKPKGDDGRGVILERIKSGEISAKDGANQLFTKLNLSIDEAWQLALSAVTA